MYVIVNFHQSSNDLSHNSQDRPDWTPAEDQATAIEEEVPVEVEYEEDVIEDREVEEDVVQEIRVPQVKALYKYKGQGLGIEKGEVRVLVTKSIESADVGSDTLMKIA